MSGLSKLRHLHWSIATFDAETREGDDGAPSSHLLETDLRLAAMQQHIHEVPVHGCRHLLMRGLAGVVQRNASLRSYEREAPLVGLLRLHIMLKDNCTAALSTNQRRRMVAVTEVGGLRLHTPLVSTRTCHGSTVHAHECSQAVVGAYIQSLAYRSYLMRRIEVALQASVHLEAPRCPAVSQFVVVRPFGMAN